MRVKNSTHHFYLWHLLSETLEKRKWKKDKKNFYVWHSNKWKFSVWTEYNNQFSITYQGKKVGEKWLNFLQVTKFFPDFLFPDQYFSPIFFHLTKNLSRFFLSRIIIIISHLFAKFIITIFFWCTLSIFNKNFEIRVKATSESKELKKITAII